MAADSMRERIAQLISQSRVIVEKEQIPPYRALERLLSDIQMNRDQEFAQACFPDVLCDAIVAGCWHYRSLSHHGSIWAIYPQQEWELFERLTGAFDPAYRFTQVMTDFFRRGWLNSSKETHEAPATVILQRTTEARQRYVQKDKDSLTIEYPAKLAEILLGDFICQITNNNTDQSDSKDVLRKARLDTYLAMCHSANACEYQPILTFLNEFSAIEVFGAPGRTTYPPRDPMDENEFRQSIDPLLQLLQSSIFWLEYLTRKTNKSLSGFLLLYPPGKNRNGGYRLVWPWCSVNLAIERGTSASQEFYKMHSDVFHEIFDYVYGTKEPQLGDFAPGAELSVLRLAEKLSRQKHEGQALSFHVVTGLPSAVHNGLRCSLPPLDYEDSHANSGHLSNGQATNKPVRDDRLTYYLNEGQDREPEILQPCPVQNHKLRPDPSPPEEVSRKCSTHPECTDHEIHYERVACAILGNYSFFQQRDAVLWAQTDGDTISLHRATFDRGFLFPAQLRTRYEVIEELCKRNPALVVYECGSEGVYRIKCTHPGGGIKVQRGQWTGDRFAERRQWKPWEAVKKAYERYFDTTLSSDDLPQWCKVLYRVIEKLVDNKQGGAFVLVSSVAEADQLSYPMTRVYFERYKLEDSYEDDLYHLAIEDGAVVLCVDDQSLVLGRRYLMPAISSNDKQWYGSEREAKTLKNGARHTSARLLSMSKPNDTSRVVVLCVSADGPITLYYDGTSIDPPKETS